LLNPILSRFCEIYINVKSDVSTTLVSLALPKTLTSSDQEIITHYRAYVSGLHQPDVLIKNAIQWCEDGWSAHDWMQCLSDDVVSEIPVLSQNRMSLLYLIRMCYYKIKPDFRCEKMLMFYLLYFTFISSKEDLENMLL